MYISEGFLLGRLFFPPGAFAGVPIWHWCCFEAAKVAKCRWSRSSPGLLLSLCNDRLSSPSNQASIHAMDSPRLYSSQVRSMKTTHQSARRSASQSAGMINDNLGLAAAGPVRGDFRWDGWWVCHTHPRCGLTAGTEKRIQRHQLRVGFIVMCSAQAKNQACEQESQCSAALLVRKGRGKKANVTKRQNVGMNSVVVIAEARTESKTGETFSPNQMWASDRIPTIKGSSMGGTAKGMIGP